MRQTFITRTLLASALAGALAFGASAQSSADRAKEKELETARAELQRAAKRVAELSRELGRPGEGAFVFEHRFVRKPVLGVLLDEDASRGVLVSGVTPGSGAARAGLRSGDRIVSVDGEPVTGATPAERLRELRAMLERLEEGKAVRVGYERDGRASVASVTPRQSAPATLFSEDGAAITPRGDVVMRRGPDGRMDVEAREVTHAFPPGRAVRIERIRTPDADGRVVEKQVVIHDVRGGKDGDVHAFAFETPGVAPEVRREVIRLARDATCKDGKDCRTVALSEAFRWNGLNLASVDAQLGRYFGADSGVLVVSAGPELGGLQSGDVIRRVDGKAVANPREVMDQLRGKPEGASVAVDVLRDRKALTTQVKAPKAMRIPLPPPAPPAPPAPPSPPAAEAPPAPPAPHAPVPGRVASVALAPEAPRPPVAPSRID